jgi:hypothetical protein
MTICIAAICENGHAIVVAADREVGIQITASELLDGKFHHLFGQWSIGISGTVTNATDVIGAARKLRPTLQSLSVLDTRTAVEKAYRQVRLARAEGRFLANRGWTLDEFKAVGSSKLPPTTYASIDAQISFFDFEADLIIAGFGEGDDGPSILTVRNPGLCVDHSKLGFWCVGSGSTAAQMALFARNYSWNEPVEKAAYLVLEAKINAEHASGVGTSTDLHLIHKDKGRSTPVIIPIGTATLDTLKGISAELKPRPFTQEHAETIGKTNEFQIFRKSLCP